MKSFAVLLSAFALIASAVIVLALSIFQFPNPYKQGSVITLHTNNTGLILLELGYRTACLSYPDLGAFNDTIAAQPRKGCITLWNTALTPSDLSAKLIQSVGLNGNSSSARYNASIAALSQGAGALRDAGLFNHGLAYAAFGTLGVHALVMLTFFLAVRLNSSRYKCCLLLLLGTLLAAFGLMLAGSFYFALDCKLGMLSLVPTLHAKSGPTVFVTPGQWIRDLALIGFVLAAVYSLLTGGVVFRRSCRGRSGSSDAESNETQDEPKRSDGNDGGNSGSGFMFSQMLTLNNRW